jgi:hypothetical protein
MQLQNAWQHAVGWPDASQGRCPASLEIGQSLFEQLVKPAGLDVSFNCLIETVSFQSREPVAEAREIGAFQTLDRAFDVFYVRHAAIIA